MKVTREPADATPIEVFSSFDDADRALREYWWNKTPEERMAALERLRELNYGYGEGTGNPRPKFQRVLKIAQLGGS